MIYTTTYRVPTKWAGAERDAVIVVEAEYTAAEPAGTYSPPVPESLSLLSVRGHAGTPDFSDMLDADVRTAIEQELLAEIHLEQREADARGRLR